MAKDSLNILSRFSFEETRGKPPAPNKKYRSYDSRNSNRVSAEFKQNAPVALPWTVKIILL
jgi:hypothetical protein